MTAPNGVLVLFCYFRKISQASGNGFFGAVVDSLSTPAGYTKYLLNIAWSLHYLFILCQLKIMCLISTLD